MAREPYVALLMAAYGSRKNSGRHFFYKRKFFLNDVFFKEIWGNFFRFFSGMALTELQLEICGAHGFLSQKGCRPLH